MRICRTVFQMQMQMIGSACLNDCIPSSVFGPIASEKGRKECLVLPEFFAVRYGSVSSKKKKKKKETDRKKKKKIPALGITSPIKFLLREWFMQQTLEFSER